MNRTVLIWVAGLAVATAAIVGGLDVRRQREFRRLVAAGDAALASDQTFGAVEAFTGAITLRRDAMLGWLKRGDTYRRRGEYAAARRDLREATRLDPTSPRALELLGDVHSGMGDQPQAIALYRQALALDDRAAPVMYKLALAQYKQGDAAAMETTRRALAIDGSLPEAHYLLGMCLRDRRRATEAVAAFSRAIALDPGFAAAREELAALYADLGRRREGLEQLEALAALDPAHPGRIVSLAQTYTRLGRRDAAALTVARGLDRYPDSADIYVAKARLALDAANDRPDRRAVNEALEALRTAESLAGSTSELLALRGEALYLAGDTTAAERVLQQAVARLPAEPAAYRYLAAAAQRLGHDEAARAARARYEALTGER